MIQQCSAHSLFRSRLYRLMRSGLGISRPGTSEPGISRLGTSGLRIACLVLAVHPASAEEARLTPTADERLPGGDTSQRHRSDRNSYYQPAANLNPVRKLDFEIGRAIFEKFWVFTPSSTTASDGLGPLYNARSCATCHQRNGRGQPFSKAADGDGNYPVDLSLLLKLSRQADSPTPSEQRHQRINGSLPDPTYGRQLQPFAWPGEPAEARATVSYQYQQIHFKDGSSLELRHPRYTLNQLSAGPLHPDTRLSARLTPPMIGLGLLEAIPDSSLQALADPKDIDNDGISGRINRVWDPVAQQQAIGRFGWKASAASLDQQNLNALNHDLGIGNWLHPAGWGDCTQRQSRCQALPHGNTDSQDGLEAARQITDVLLLYTRNIAVPQRYSADAPAVQAGRKLFSQAGCQSCHTPSFTTASRKDMPEQSNQTIWPYTDLLLHDMGEALADPYGEFQASGREWRTAPLWGIGLNQAVNGHQAYLHDGRARTLMEAILWHGGEAEAARNRVLEMDLQQRTQLIQFLESL